MSENVDTDVITEKLNTVMPELEEVEIYIDLTLNEAYKI